MAEPTPTRTFEANQRSPVSDINPGGLGRYFSSITLYDYERPDVLATAIPRRMQTIYLPLPDGLSDNSQAEWGDAAQGALGTIFQKGPRSGDLLQGARDAGAAALLGSVGSVASQVKNMVLGTGIASSIVDNMVPAEALTAFVQQSIVGGAAQNPNPTQIFRGPSLRSYSLGWTFMPRSSVESAKVKKIIHSLKQASLPTPRYGDTMAILAYPQLAQINFYPWDDKGSGKHGWSDDSIIRYKTSVITAVSVNYAPSNVPAFNTDDARPAIITLRMDFKETEYMVASDWGGNQKSFWQGTGDNIPKDGWQEASGFLVDTWDKIKGPLTTFSGEANNLDASVQGTPKVDDETKKEPPQS